MQINFFRLTNLKYWSRSEQIINRTLQLLSDLSVGYTSVRKLVKLDEVQFMLNNHTVSIHVITKYNDYTLPYKKCKYLLSRGLTCSFFFLLE